LTDLKAGQIIVLTALRFGLRPWQLERRAGNAKGAHWRLVSTAKREAMRAMRDQGASLLAIARALNCGHQPVWRGLRRLVESAGPP